MPGTALVSRLNFAITKFQDYGFEFFHEILHA